MLTKFEKFLADLMHVDVFFIYSGAQPVCRFNQFRSRKKYLEYCNLSLEGVWRELHKKELSVDEQRYLFIRLEEAGGLFVLDAGKVVSHRYLLISCAGKFMSVDDLDEPCYRLLEAYLEIQHAAWSGLLHLCRELYSYCRGSYVWKKDTLSLLELGDALWTQGIIGNIGGESTKKAYLRQLLSFFNLPDLHDPCHRLGELGKRSVPHAFLQQLSAEYGHYWADKESGLSGAGMIGKGFLSSILFFVGFVVLLC